MACKQVTLVTIGMLRLAQHDNHVPEVLGVLGG